MPRQKSLDEIRKEIKYKKSWKSPGIGGKEFNAFDTLKPKVLSYWEMQRVTMPKKCYERYPVEKAFKQVRAQGGEFGFIETVGDLSEQHRKFLAQHKDTFKVS